MPQGIYRSVDGGKTWKLVFQKTVEDISYKNSTSAIAPRNQNNASHMYAVGTTWVGNKSIMALFKSTDGGQNWTTHKITSTDSYAYALGFHPSNSNVIFAGGEVKNKAALFKSTNGGSNWTEIGKSVFNKIRYPHITCIALDPKNKNRIYVGTAKGIYKSENNGSSWKKIYSTNTSSILINPKSPNKIYAGTYGGVYCSTNSGKTWQKLENGVAVADVNCLEMNTKTKTLYAGTNRGGIFKTTLPSSYGLELSSSKGGTTDPMPETHSINSETQVEITAKPDVNYKFSHWSGDISGTENPITVTMDSDIYIKANFVKHISAYILSISASNGGTTIPSPGLYSFKPGTKVTITVIPNTSFKFSHWSGDTSEKVKSITIILDSNKSVRAHFFKKEFRSQESEFRIKN